MVPGDEIKYLSALPQSANTKPECAERFRSESLSHHGPSNSCVPASYDAQAMYYRTGHS
jgi:hypothetical protein